MSNPSRPTRPASAPPKPADTPPPKIKDPPQPPRGGDRPGETPVEMPPRDPALRKIGPEDEDRWRRDDER
ncbi:hypothetical protein [Vineibacter terrae]|uniref:hypothetical protein n=1 Tax=Vineibacter terrae TaxID=2586908 RepID=UPI002E321761|nr:hypothetical protein [Vineibacter terrae]HEX2891853.1 hypothetical protein [Vineibacter terrae]